MIVEYCTVYTPFESEAALLEQSEDAALHLLELLLGALVHFRLERERRPHADLLSGNGAHCVAGGLHGSHVADAGPAAARPAARRPRYAHALQAAAATARLKRAAISVRCARHGAHRGTPTSARLQKINTIDCTSGNV